MSQLIEAAKGFMQRFLDAVERVGNKVPHPAVIFFDPLAIVIGLSAGNETEGEAISKFTP